jgi:hypothetical protein
LAEIDSQEGNEAATFELTYSTTASISSLFPAPETLILCIIQVQGTGTLLLKYPLPEGRLALQGRLEFQPCSETVCEHPQTLPFELGLTLEPFLISERDKKR